MLMEKEYRDTVNRLAFAMLTFEGLFFLGRFVNTLVHILTASIPIVIVGTLVYELCYGLVYAGVFALPVLFFRLFSGHKTTQRMYMEFKLPRESVLYIFAALAMISAAVYVNSFMVDLIEINVAVEEVVSHPVVTSNYEMVLMVIIVAVVPAFVEELLFRGMILTNLLPYGRTTAVLASALLFGLMHQNIGQIFYTTVGGLVLGFIYVKTRSIWVGVLIHFVNNFISVIQDVISERLTQFNVNLVLGLMEGVIFALGIVSAVILLHRAEDHRTALFTDGCFELDLPADPDYAGEVIPFGRRVRLFFTVPMIVFVVICIAQMFSLFAIIESFLWG